MRDIEEEIKACKKALSNHKVKSELMKEYIKHREENWGV